MEQLNYKLEGVSDQRNTEVLRKFLAMAVLGVIKSYVLNQLHVGIEEIAKSPRKRAAHQSLNASAPASF